MLQRTRAAAGMTLLLFQTLLLDCTYGLQKLSGVCLVCGHCSSLEIQSNTKSLNKQTFFRKVLIHRLHEKTFARFLLRGLDTIGPAIAITNDIPV